MQNLNVTTSALALVPATVPAISAIDAATLAATAIASANGAAAIATKKANISKASKRKLGNGAPVKAKPAVAVKPATVKPAVQAEAKPAKPDNAAKLAAREAANSERLGKLNVMRVAVATNYNGPSLTAHRFAPTKLAAILDRIAAPSKPYNTTTRTGSLAVRIAEHLTSAKPNVAHFLCVGADLGVIAMLASGGILKRSGDTVTVDNAKLRACISASLGDKHIPAAFRTKAHASA